MRTTRIAVAALALTVLSACASGDGAAPAATGASVPELAGTSWNLASYAGADGTQTPAVTEPSVGTVTFLAGGAVGRLHRLQPVHRHVRAVGCGPVHHHGRHDRDGLPRPGGQSRRRPSSPPWPRSPRRRLPPTTSSSRTRRALSCSPTPPGWPDSRAPRGQPPASTTASRPSSPTPPRRRSPRSSAPTTSSVGSAAATATPRPGPPRRLTA